jgi:FkbM family methyltransferase
MQSNLGQAKLFLNRGWANVHITFRQHDAYNGFYESVLKDLSSYYIPNGGVVVDCGANVGKHTLNFARLVGATGKVIAIEPNPETFALLEGRVGRNKNGARIELRNAAVGSEKSEISFFANTRSPALSSVLVDCAGDETDVRKITVACEKVDDIAAKCDRVDFIKIDVEGFEYEALKGARATIERYQPVIFFENNRGAGEKAGFYTRDGFLDFFLISDICFTRPTA